MNFYNKSHLGDAVTVTDFMFWLWDTRDVENSVTVLYMCIALYLIRYKLEPLLFLLWS